MITIADSSGLISLFIQTDSNHVKALQIQQSLTKNTDKLFIASEVFSETLNLLGKKFSHKAAMQVAQTMLSLQSFIFIDSDETIRLSALHYFKESPVSVSYTDCLVMAFADHFDTKIILGFDGIFSKSGYKLPGSS